MKAFQTILFLAIIILIGGMAALYWGKTIEDATVPVVADDEPVEETADEELSPGTYLVFQVDETNFYRLPLREAINRLNLTINDLVKFADIAQPLSVSGGLVAYMYGQDLLLHRYLDEDQDGVMSLSGEIVETRPIQWGTIRSANGRYQINFEMDRGSGRSAITNLIVSDINSKSILLEKMLNPEELDGGWDLEPFVIDDLGKYVYIHEVCGCEATLSGIWQLEIATGELTRLDVLVDLDSWFLSSLDAENRRLLAISTDREPAEDGPYDELLPPTTIKVLNLDTLESTDLLVDEEQAWDEPWLDPERNDRYIVRAWDEGNKLYIVGFEDTVITDENYLTEGWVVDWVGDWIIVNVQGYDSILYKLINLETREEILIDLPERSSYIGSIERE